MTLQLRDHIHWCECAGRIVFLDIDADRYFCLPPSANPAFVAMAMGQADVPEHERLQMLTDRGFLVSSARPDGFQQPAVIERPARDFLGDTVPRSRVVPLLGALWWECRAALQLRTRTLSEVIARAARRRRNLLAASSRNEESVRSIAAAADAIAFITRSHNRCLVRALAVHAACRARGIPAKLVVGVIAHPFAAHSWVQMGDAVLVGAYEQARLYTPILVLE